MVLEYDETAMFPARQSHHGYNLGGFPYQQQYTAQDFSQFQVSDSTTGLQQIPAAVSAAGSPWAGVYAYTTRSDAACRVGGGPGGLVEDWPAFSVSQSQGVHRGTTYPSYCSTGMSNPMDYSNHHSPHSNASPPISTASPPAAHTHPHPHGESGISAKMQNRAPYEWMKKQTYPSAPQAGKTRTKDKYRVVYSDHQRLELEKEFHYSKYITIRRKAELAQNLVLSERQVKIWFQNRRAKERKQNKKRDETVAHAKITAVELDHGMDHGLHSPTPSQVQ